MAQQFVQGMDEAARALRKIKETIQANQLEEATLKAADPIERAARDRAPERKKGGGTLKRSISHEVKVKKPHEVVTVVGPDKPGFYGMYFEIGTFKMPASPWLEPAFLAKKDEAIKNAADVLKSKLFRAAISLEKTSGKFTKKRAKIKTVTVRR